jgi:phage terminase large subunit-like protein
MPAATRTYPYVELADEYALDVLAGKVSACRYVQLACERQRRDLAQYAAGSAPFYFDQKAADRVCDIISRFPHIKGVWAQERQKLSLEPWQCFILSTVFGWKSTATGRRRFKVAYIEVPRKNAKSTITSAVGNYMVACDGEAGAYVVSAANTRDQAKLVFVDSQIMARREEGFRSKFGVEVLAHVIAVPETASKYEALSAEHSNLDGLNLHAALIDELHAHPTRGLWDVLETATGSRAQSLIWAITTAGVNRAGVCFDQRSHLIDILNGHTEDDSYFGIIYTVDDGDDPWDEETWAKANPNWGISIYPETIRSEAKRAQHMPSAQNAFFNKHLNIWTNADIAWLPAGSWDKCLDPKLDMEDFERQPCYLGLDLARRSDITAMMIVFPPAAGREWWAVFGRYYLPEQTVSRAENSHYQGWETMGRLVSTPGNVTDFDYIIANLADIAARFDVQEIVFDPFDAGPAVNAIQKEGIKKPIVDVKQSAANMSPAMVELEGLVLSKKIRHDGDPILAWMMANVRCRRTAGDLMQPDKENDSKKIDGVTATLMCIHRALRRDRPAAARVQILSMEDDE